MLALFFIKEKNASNKKIWLLSVWSALFVSWYSGTIGALFGEYIVRGGLRTPIAGGYVGVNIEGILIWGTIYAIIFLPVSIPIAYATILPVRYLLLVMNLIPKEDK